MRGSNALSNCQSFSLTMTTLPNCRSGGMSKDLAHSQAPQWSKAHGQRSTGSPLLTKLRLAPCFAIPTPRSARPLERGSLPVVDVCRIASARHHVVNGLLTNSVPLSECMRTTMHPLDASATRMCWIAFKTPAAFLLGSVRTMKTVTVSTGCASGNG